MLKVVSAVVKEKALKRMRAAFFLFFFSSLSCAVFSQGGTLRGRLSSAANNEALSGATLSLQNTQLGAVCDSAGNYQITGIEPGLYNLEASLSGYRSKLVFEVQVQKARVTIVNVELEEEGTKLQEVEITASGFNKTLESPVSLRTIGANEIQRYPGGNRDISRVIQSLPGVGSSAGFRYNIAIRGGAPNENRFYLDGIEIPSINHFSVQGLSGGPAGLVNVDLIREVDFYSGAFPAMRGNALSSVMEIKYRNGKDDRPGFRATVGSSDLALTAEGPLGKSKRTTYIVSARRSYLQALFYMLGQPFLPTYNDFQFKLHSRLSEKNELTVLGIGAIDRFALNLAADTTEEQKYYLGNIPSSSQWNYTTGIRLRHFKQLGYWDLVASQSVLQNQAEKYRNNQTSDPSQKIWDYASAEMENKLRWEHTLHASGYKVSYGISYEFDRYRIDQYKRSATLTGIDTMNFHSVYMLQRYGLFVQAGKRFWADRLALSAGIRSDGNTWSSKMANPLAHLSPRLSAALNLTKKIILNFNSGIYYQLPPHPVLGYRDASGELANKNRGVDYIRCSHLVGGLEYAWSASGKITAEGFYKRYANYPFQLNDSVSLANMGGDYGVIGNEPVTSSGKGKAYGIELMAQQKLVKGFYGMLSYTWLRSEFTDRYGNYRPSSWENRSILALTCGKKFKRNWEIGLRMRYFGGTPYTPYDMQRSALIQVWDITGQGVLDYSNVNSLRYPSAYQVDFRVDKKWFFKNWTLDLYLDLANLSRAQIQLQPNVDVLRNPDGTPSLDPAHPDSYLLKLVPNSIGTMVPTIGVVIDIR